MATVPPPPAFVVGISGYMDIPVGDRDVIAERLRAVFRWLRLDEHELAEYPSWWPEFEEQPENAARLSLPGLGLGAQRIILLTSLAPGADTIAAQLAHEEGIEVRAPLPFPAEIYRRSTSFCGDGVVAGAQQVFDGLIADSSNPIEAFPVVLECDLDLDPHARIEKFSDDLEDPERSDRRYRASGEFVAASCHLLIAIYDLADDYADGVEIGAGTGSIVHVRRSGPTSAIVPEADDLPWNESGPVFHLPARSIKRLRGPSALDDSSWLTSSARFLPPYPASDPAPLPAAPPSAAAVAASYLELREIASSLAG